MGQTEKSGWSPPTSVVPLKADTKRAAQLVRFVPITEVVLGGLNRLSVVGLILPCIDHKLKRVEPIFGGRARPRHRAS